MSIANIIAQIVGKFTKSSVRVKSFAAFLSTSFASRAVTIACQTIQVPIVLKGIGPEAFGYWMTLTSINYMMNFADFGLGMGLQNKLADAFAKDQKTEARTLFGSTFVALLAIGLILGILAGGALLFIDFPTLFQLKDIEVRAHAGEAAAISLSMLCLGLPLGLGQRLAYSKQLGWWHNASQAISAIVTLACLTAATYLQWDFLTYFIAGILPTVIINAALVLALCSYLGWKKISQFSIKFSAVRSVLSLGAHFSIQQILNTVLYALPAIIISSSLGATAVTPFNLVQRLFNLFAVAQNSFMLALWPMYSEAHAKNEFGWIRKTLRKSCVATLATAIGPMILGAIFATPIINLWVGNEAPVASTALIWLLFFWNAAQFLQQPFWFLLAGVSEINRLTWYSLGAAVLCLTSMFLLVRPFGAEGVVAGLLIGYVPLLLGSAIAHTFLYLKEAERKKTLPPEPILVIS